MYCLILRCENTSSRIVSTGMGLRGTSCPILWFVFTTSTNATGLFCLSSVHSERTGIRAKNSLHWAGLSGRPVFILLGFLISLNIPAGTTGHPKILSVPVLCQVVDRCDRSDSLCNACPFLRQPAPVRPAIKRVVLSRSLSTSDGGGGFCKILGDEHQRVFHVYGLAAYLVARRSSTFLIPWSFLRR